MRGPQLLPRPRKLIELSCLSLSGKLTAWATNLISMRSENHLGKGLYLKKWEPRCDQPELGAMPWHKGVREKILLTSKKSVIQTYLLVYPNEQSSLWIEVIAAVKTDKFVSLETL